MIYIATHKKFVVPQKERYIPLQVGAEGKDDLGYVRDNTGDNISNRNANYCELTGAYWIWKNCKDAYIGLVHYRRYFGKSVLGSNYKSIYSYQEMVDLLNGYDMVLPNRESYKTTARAAMLRRCTTETVYSKLREVIKRVYSEYLMDFDEFFEGNKASQYNMIFSKKSVFDSYCQWLFDVLFELEKDIDLNDLDQLQQRVYGYLSERLLNVWVIHNKLKVRYVPTVQTELNFMDKIKLIRRKYTNELRFRLTHISLNSNIRK